NKQKILIEEKNKDITDSIRYSKRIQQAILPDGKKFSEFLPESFICYMPRDIVSGDFYWYKYLRSNFFDENKGTILKPLLVFAAADCTGHGVPGAFMSLIGINLLNASAKEPDVNSPAEALDYLHENLSIILNENYDINDGMDIAMIAIDLETGLTQFAGANNPVLIFKHNFEGELSLQEIKGDKQPIGAQHLQTHSKFTNHTFTLNKGDSLYIFTDGYQDQFGGKDGKKYKYKRFKEFLLSIQHLSMQEQKNALYNEFINWKGDLDQVDDICIIGIRF
ncbi:MAG: PP2C family protein-serine/threonine phosphatase, partial [Bacteroidia bacterium]